MSWPARMKRGARITVAVKEARTYNGVLYASKLEAQRADYLDFMVRAGHLAWWIGQPLFRLGCPENKWRADFLCVGTDGEVYVEDVKGYEKDEFKRSKRLWKRYGPCPLYVVTKQGDQWQSYVVEGREGGGDGGSYPGSRCMDGSGRCMGAN